jgi:signal transduction histidine kinase/ActR/RegA family two-component response regulator
VRLIIFDGEEVTSTKKEDPPFDLTSDMKQKLMADEIDLSPQLADGTHHHIAVPIPVSGYSWGSIILESIGSHTTFDDIVIASLRNVADSLGSAITREELQAKLMHAHKMEAVGMLAGGIAHDFNNLLWPILAYSETLKEQARSENESAMLTDINVAATRAASLVEEILFMSRRRVTTNDPVCLCDVVNEVIDIGAVPLPPNLELETDLQKNAGAVLGDRTAIHRLVLNLITNARTAMLDSAGTIKVTVRQAQAKEQLPHQTDTLILEVQDQGIGMTEKVRSRLFEPYFTTRRGGRGTGLGLTIVHRVTTELGGDIQIDSEPGVGSTFRVRLPRTGQTPVLPEPSSSPVPQGEGRIMIVDDDAAVLATASQMVESLGYTVHAYENSNDALEVLQDADHQDPGIDLILTDLTMPNLDGMQLARETSLLHPNLPVLLITGFGDEVNASAAPITKLLRKPITRSDLANAIQDAISLKNN